jgi:hypothetical protein
MVSSPSSKNDLFIIHTSKCSGLQQQYSSGPSSIPCRRFCAGHCEIVIKTAIGDKRVLGEIWDFKVESGQVMSLSGGLFVGRVGGSVLGEYRAGEDSEENDGGGIFDEWGEHVGVARDDVHFEVGSDKVENDSAGQCAACNCGRVHPSATTR